MRGACLRQQIRGEKGTDACLCARAKLSVHVCGFFTVSRREEGGRRGKEEEEEEKEEEAAESHRIDFNNPLFSLTLSLSLSRPFSLDLGILEPTSCWGGKGGSLLFRLWLT